MTSLAGTRPTEGRMTRKRLYMLRGGMSTRTIKMHLLRVGIMYKRHVFIGRSFFGKW